MPSLAKRIKESSKPQVLWQGPCHNGPGGGISQSMMNDFLSCRERFRVKYIEGWQPVARFSRPMEFGNMWHCAEEEHARNGNWRTALHVHVTKLMRRFPMELGEISKWYSVILVQFPEYLKYWSQHPDVVNRVHVLSEQVFCVPYDLPSGRTIYLRGKWDKVDRVGDALVLGEHKTKSKIDLVQLQRNLKFDNQTMFYIIALKAMQEQLRGK